LLLWLQYSQSATSQRAKCAVECYMKCVNSGTPNAGYCACPPQAVYRSCNSVSDSILKAETIDDVLTVRTEYLDAHTIHIVMSRSPQAFIYIFEFSTVSTSPDDWMFAGTSVTPEITFTTRDPCRDYQFRVLVVLRSTNPRHQIAVLRPRAIQVTLPEFAVETDQITVEYPVYNSAEGTVTVYVRWKNPRGYVDADIYGYEGAAVYPIQCLSPEDELPTPTVEQVSGGGRLKVSLPAEMLEGKCRLWVEVRMLPRCVRLEPFSVQQSLELDCERLADLDICKHEVSPQCTDVIDVWGSNGNVTVMWAPPAQFGNPLYYHIRYGAAEMQGVPPFVSWTIASRREVKAAGDAKSLNMQLDEDTDYGIQICAVYNEQRKKPKFGVVGVTPFICTSCKTIPTESFGRCGECSKIEGPLLFQRRCHPKGGVGCASASSALNESEIARASPLDDTNIATDISNEPEILSVSTAPLQIQRTGTENLSIIEGVAPTIPHSKIFSPNRSLYGYGTNVITTSALPIVTPTTSILSQSPSRSTYGTNPDGAATTAKTASSNQRHHVETTTAAEFKSAATTAFSKMAEMVSFGGATVPSQVFSTTGSTKLPTALPTMKLHAYSATDTLAETQAQKEQKSGDMYRIATPVSQNFNENIEKQNSMVMAVPELRASTISTSLAAKTDKVRKPSNDENMCTLLNGVQCQFGCASHEKCECPQHSHVIAFNGACVKRTTKATPSMCLAKRDVNATWDARLRVLHIYSEEVFNEVNEKKSVDKVYIEFGQVREAKMAIGKPSQNIHLNGYIFDSTIGQRNRMIVRKDKILRHGLFLSSPFLFYVNQSVDPLAHLYGLRICTFNSSVVKNPFQKDWDKDGSESSSGDRVSNVLQVLQLSPIHFVAGLAQPSVIHESRHLSRLLFIVVPLIMIVIMIMLISALFYLNCSRIKRFYDHRRTRCFRPSIINVGASSMCPYVSRSTDTSPHTLFVTKASY
uniref:Fibronectin type-III domain-containing protein n=2 Tax=Parascaris univalens TaxID=6257 RepID=A0A915C348_PARUN